MFQVSTLSDKEHQLCHMISRDHNQAIPEPTREIQHERRKKMENAKFRLVVLAPIDRCRLCMFHSKLLFSGGFCRVFFGVLCGGFGVINEE